VGPSVLALVPAHDEADRVGATVRALLSLDSIDRVVVVDDGSSDATSERAAAAGAGVLRFPRNVGKGGAMERALDLVAPADVYCFADADLADSATGIAPLLSEVLEGRADLVVGVLPAPPTGGFGLVKRFARAAIRRVARFEAEEPLSGQRALTRECLQASRPLAEGFGLETAMLADAARLGFRIAEMPVSVEHRFTRKDLSGFRHRARQGLDVVRAAAPRLAGLR
jgi:glycosyltransferase involved in cell wall biosynthesis